MECRCHFWNQLKAFFGHPATGTIINVIVVIVAFMSLRIGAATLQDAKSATERTAVNSEPQVDVMSRFDERRQVVFDISNYGGASANYVQIACITKYRLQAAWPILSDSDKAAIVAGQQILIRRLSAGGPTRRIYSSECRVPVIPKGSVADSIFIFVAYESAARIRHYESWLYQVDKYVNGFLQTVPVTDQNIKTIFDFYKQAYDERQGSIDSDDSVARRSG